MIQFSLCVFFFSFTRHSLEMAEGRPPNGDITNMTALLELPKRPSPKLKNPKQWSPSMNDFLAKCLTKDSQQRPSALDMLIHPFLTDSKGAEALKNIIKECLAIQRGQMPV
jgi:serine/threonine protein kinase